MRYTPTEPTQVQISKSLPECILILGGSTSPTLLQPGESYPFMFRGQTPVGLWNLGTSYFIGAPNVTHGWNIRNASQIIRNLELNFSTSSEPNGEIEYTLEYQIKSAGVPILIAYEYRTIRYKGGEARESRQETSFNYEPVRSQYVIPGSGIELSVFFRNAKQISGEPVISSLTIVLNNAELNVNVERL